MSQALSFNEISLVPFPVKNDNQTWLRSADIARALGYKRPDILSKLYSNNADEFTSDMTQVVEILDNTDSVGTGNSNCQQKTSHDRHHLPLQSAYAFAPLRRIHSGRHRFKIFFFFPIWRSSSTKDVTKGARSLIGRGKALQ